MDEVFQVMYSPSKLYKVEIIKRNRDGLFTFLIHKWIEHDPDIKEYMSEEGFWGPLFTQKSLSDTAERAIQIALEDLQNKSSENIILTVEKEVSMHSKLREPWHILEDQFKGMLEKELESELSAIHRLYHKDLTAFARSYASDDVLFHEISTGQYYLVHLTWDQNKNERFPSFSVFFSFDDFIQYCEDTFQFNED
ncbi:hypothetical protein [Paenibacillus pedocola]|uniref:hypothetical protein n=1 Tax=Paenibacillus pedocola TaxID=3242193 RepID=UPI002878155D|nr:hypothetical protein [Paenibacillus typhae]